VVIHFFYVFWITPSIFGYMSFRLRLDVDIGALSIELVSMPNHTRIGIGLQYQSHCLDAEEIAIDGIKEQANTDSSLDVHTCGI